MQAELTDEERREYEALVERAKEVGFTPLLLYRLVETNHLLPLTHAQVFSADANPRPPFIQSSAASESHALCARSSRRPTRRSWRMPCPMSPRPPRARASTSQSKKWTSLIMSSPSQWYALLPPLGHPHSGMLLLLLLHHPTNTRQRTCTQTHMHSCTHAHMHTCTCKNTRTHTKNTKKQIWLSKSMPVLSPVFFFT
jgi:hypothetical protein